MVWNHKAQVDITTVSQYIKVIREILSLLKYFREAGRLQKHFVR